MKYKVYVMHIENITEYRIKGTTEVVFPSDKQKLFWSLFGYVDDIEKYEEERRTHIDTIEANTKREIDRIFNERYESEYSKFIPKDTISVTNQLEIIYV